MSQKVTYEEFMQRLSKHTDTIVVLSEFLGLHKPLKCKCLVCGYEWITNEARSILRYGCKKCTDKIRCQNSGIARRKTEEQFRAELAIVQPNLVPNDTYITDNTKYHCVCSIHGCDVYKTPEKMLRRNQGCDICAIERNKCATRYTHKTFCGKVKSTNPNIQVLSQYKNIKTRIDVVCLECGHKWSPIAEVLVRDTKYICPKCAGNAVKTPDEFRGEIKQSHPYLMLLSDYERSAKEVHVLCNRCGNDFWILPNKLQQGQNCNCINESHGESRIRQFLDNNRIEYESQKTFDNLVGTSGFRKLSYDFYIPSKNLLLEYQGKQHDRPAKFGASITDDEAVKRFERQIIHDRNKENYAKENGYDFLEIWYWDFKNIDSILSKVINI